MSPLFRIFLLILATLGAGMRLQADQVIRILAGNLTSGNFQNYDPGDGNRIFQGLRPDIAMVQEMNYLNNTVADLRGWVDTNFGSGFAYVRQSGTGIQIPNGIVSRYPVRASGVWDDTTMSNRDYVWAQIDIPGDKDLWAVSVHISSGGGATQRNEEAGEIKAHIQAQVPAGDYLVIGGDLNTDTRTEACITTLSSVVVTSGPFPADQANNANTNASRAKPYDWVLPDADLNALRTPLVIGTVSFPNGLVFDSRRYTPLTAVTPVLSTDSSATNMQHMAVLRAFSIPVNVAPTVANPADSASTERVTDPESTIYEIVRAKTVGLTVAGSDDGGEAALKYTWASVPGGVTFSVNGTNAAKSTLATFPAIGNYTLTATLQDAPGLTVTSAVKVRVVQAAASLALSPSSATLAVNATQTFSATVLDQFGQAMTAAIAYTTNGGGTIAASGIFTATTAGGPFGVTASGGGFSKTAAVTVTRAAASVSLGNLAQTYDGNAKSVTYTTTPSGLPVTILYGSSSAPPVNAGSYPVTAEVSDPNYQGSATGTLVVGKAVAEITLTALAAIYDGSPKPVSATTTPTGLALAISYNGQASAPVEPGSYSVIATLAEANFQGTATATLVISPDAWTRWKDLHFTAQEKADGLAADGADPDADGRPNLVEYALGSDPRAFSVPLTGAIDAGAFSLEFTRPAGLPGISYFVESSVDLKAWALVLLEITATGPQDSLKASVPLVDGPHFLRLRVERGN